MDEDYRNSRYRSFLLPKEFRAMTPEERGTLARLRAVNVLKKSGYTHADIDGVSRPLDEFVYPLASPNAR